MALELNFELYTRRNSTQLVFEELTGVYSSSNTSGWGSPNDSLSSVSSWVVSITTPSSTTPYVFTDPSNLPSNSNGTIIITPTQLGYTTGLISDGIYEVEYEVVTTNGTYRKVLRFPIFSNVECCVKRMVLKLIPGCCCSNKYVEQYLLAKANFDSLEVNAEFGNETLFNNFLTKLQLICSYSDCGCS